MAGPLRDADEDDEVARVPPQKAAELAGNAQYEGDARVARVLEAMSTAFLSLDRSWRFSYVNAEAERLLRRPREQLIGGSLWDLFPNAVASQFEEQYRRAVDTGQPTMFELYFPLRAAWYEVRASPGSDGLAVHFLDITARRAAQQRAERAARRATLLGAVASQLAGTLNAEEAVARLARLVVPTLADWCVVTLVDDTLAGPAWRQLRDIGSWHADPALRPVVERYAATRLSALSDRSFLAQALATGQAVMIPADATAAVSAVLAPGEARDLLAILSPRTGAILPLRAHGRTLGLLTLFSKTDSEPAPEDLETAAEVAARAGLALDNARLYEQQRRLAEGLQRSLLTAPPEPDHMQVVVRYEPAAEAAQVGGDWYDAFLQASGATVLVIGDVVGHDVEAAAAMGQLRGLLRGIAATTGEGPANVLTRLDAAMELLAVGTTASAVVVRLEQTDEERARGVSHMRWSNAGHPPPIVINPDGTVLILGGGPADVLLGIDPGTDRSESEVTLDRGATVLLYTDGLVERRGQPFDEGVAKLRKTLGELAGRDLNELCDEVLRRMLPAAAEDDVALAAVRLHPQDRPRPPDAGPEQLPPAFEPESSSES